MIGYCQIQGLRRYHSATTSISSAPKDVGFAADQVDKPVGVLPAFQFLDPGVGVGDQRPADQEQRLLVIELQQRGHLLPQVEERGFLVNSEEEVRLLEGLESTVLCLLEHYAGQVVGIALVAGLDAPTFLLPLLRCILALKAGKVLVVREAFIHLLKQLHRLQQLVRLDRWMGQTQNAAQPLYTRVAEEHGRTIVKAGSRLFQLRVASYPDQHTSLQRQTQLKANKLLTNEHLISLCHFESQQDQNFCSTFYRICLFFEYLPHTLASEIQARRGQQNKFTGKELWSILCSCTLAFSYLQQHKVEGEYLSLKDIMLSDDGVIKLNHPDNISDNQSNAVFNSSCFYAPEQGDGLAVNKSKAGVYQLGLAVLTCIDLLTECEIYTSEGMVDLSQVDQRLRNVSKIVEKKIYQMLNVMLNPNPTERPDWITLQKLILETIQTPLRETPVGKVKDVPVYRVPDSKLSPPCQPSPTDESDQPQLLQSQSQIDQQVRDQNNNDMMETNRFQEESVLKESNRQNTTRKDSDEKQKPTLNGAIPQIVNEEFDGGRYEGQKVDGYREGYGTFHYSQGGIYTGNWHLNKMEGEGCLYYPSGKLAYEGSWENDKLHGYGTLYSEDVVKLKDSFDYRSFDNIGDFWIKYEGYFLDDNKEGKGKLVLSNGEWFNGQFSEDKVHGDGEFFRKDGVRILGRWHRNKMVK